MRHTLIWQPLAKFHARVIADYIARDSKPAARKALTAIIDAPQPLIEMPYIGRVGRIEGTRELVVKNYPYILAYRVQNDAIEILDVIHTAREWPTGFH